MLQGGKRQGAGRPKIHPLHTKVIRIPVEEIALVKRFLNNKKLSKHFKSVFHSWNFWDISFGFICYFFCIVYSGSTFL